MTAWPKRALEEVAAVNYGTRVTRKQDAGSRYPVYGGGGATFAMDVSNRDSCYIVARFGMSEQCVRYVDGPFFLNDSGLTVDVLDARIIEQRFLDTWLLASQPEIYALGRGTAQRNLNVDAFKRLLVPLPPLEEQKRIVTVLDQAFAALDRARALAEANLADAVGLLALATDVLFKRACSSLPTGKMGDYCAFEGGFAFKSGDAVDSSDVQIIRIGNLYKNVLDLDRNPVFYPSEYSARYARFKLSTGDIIMSLTGTVGKQDGLVPVLRRSPECLKLTTGDRRDDDTFRRVQAGGRAHCADQRVVA